MRGRAGMHAWHGGRSYIITGVPPAGTSVRRAKRAVYARGDRESDFLGFREASGLDTISRHFPAGIGKFVNI